LGFLGPRQNGDRSAYWSLCPPVGGTAEGEHADCGERASGGAAALLACSSPAIPISRYCRAARAFELQAQAEVRLAKLLTKEIYAAEQWQ